MFILIIVILIILLILLLLLGIRLFKWTIKSKGRIQLLLIILTVSAIGIGIHHFFFKNMRFIQSEVYPNLYLVKYPVKDYSVVEEAIKEKIKEHLSSEYKTGKPLSYTGEKAIYFYELGGMSFGFLGEAGTGYFIDHEEDLGGFVSEELGMYQDYRLAEFYYEPCSRDNSLVCGEINFFREGEHVKVDRLEDLYSVHKEPQTLSGSPRKTNRPIKLPFHGVLDIKAVAKYYPEILTEFDSIGNFFAQRIPMPNDRAGILSLLRRTDSYTDYFLYTHDQDFKTLDSFYLGKAMDFDQGKSVTIEYEINPDSSISFHKVVWGPVLQNKEETIDTLSHDTILLRVNQSGKLEYTISNQDLTIEKLKEAYKTKNETQFLKQFPANFHLFMAYFGWDSDSNQANPLYEESYEYIVYFFDLLSLDKYRKFESKLMGIAANGVWQEDGVNYFQNSAIEYIKRNNSYHLIDELPSKEAQSVLFFLFDGPHPQFDADFSSHLSPAKKEILEELFESAWYDDNENPAPIDYEEPKSYEITDFENREHYFIRDIDLNQDHILDKIVSADPYQGDELYLFLKNGDAYEFALKTINFSEDGGNQIVDIQPEQAGFVIKTTFPDQGILEAYHHISFEDNSWFLTHTVYRTQSSNQKDAIIYICNVKQGLSLKDRHFIEQLKGLPEEKERETLCTKEKIN